VPWHSVTAVSRGGPYQRRTAGLIVYGLPGSCVTTYGVGGASI
jgi:hypothetical protein